MLMCFDRLQKLNFAMLMQVYDETNLAAAGERGLLDAEQIFYQYLREVFFKTKRAFYAVWVENGVYVSALRIEPYKDGLLLAGLETRPSARRKGYATALVRSVQDSLRGSEPGTKIYAHIRKDNAVSLRVHTQCGFQKTADFAAYIDGSVSNDAYTFCYEVGLPAGG